MRSGHPRRSYLLAAFASLVGGLPAMALADMVTYTVDPARSSLTLSGTFGGDTLQPEAGFPNSLITPYGGTITADRDRSADTIRITDATVAGGNNGTSSPVGVGHSGQVTYAATNYAFGAGGAGSLASVSASLGGFALSFYQAGHSGLAFTTTDLVAAVKSGELDYAFSGPPPLDQGVDFPITAGVSLNGALATLTEGEGIETLTIPFNGTFTYETASGIPLDATLNGFITATAPVPEPASLAVLGLPALGLRRRRDTTRPGRRPVGA